MTNEEAISTIKTAIAEVEWYYPMKYAEAFEKAISALEKQIPKKCEMNEDRTAYICPLCRKCVGSVDDMIYCEVEPKFCFICGQALDWGNT